ncbi:MAG: ABC-type transport auxiliary lipoprotein family protein [Rhodocyclaceae bacterium]
MPNPKRLACAMLAFSATLFAGCTSLITPPPELAVYDLGHLSAGTTAAPAIVPAQIEVRAPSWLASAAMQYRLEFESPAARQSFTESRWAASPAEMVQRQLAQALIAGGPRDGRCRLRVELDEYVQVFDAPDRSAAVLSATAVLLAAREERVLDSRRFDMRIAATSADARSGVLAHRAAVAQFADALGRWLDALGREGGDALRTACMR